MSATLSSYLAKLAHHDAAATKPTPRLRVGTLPPRYVTAQLTARRQLLWRVVALVFSHAVQVILGVVGWVCIGSGALSGRLDYGWLAAWALALISTVPLSAASTWLEGLVAVGISESIKRKMLRGVIATDPDIIRAKGSGELLGEVLESEAIDGVAAGAGIATGVALLELLITPFLMFWGAAPRVQILVLLTFVAVVLVLVAINLRLRSAWARQRIALTNRLVENMSAHRTRLAQQAPSRWHAGEDFDLEHYFLASRKLDAGTARIAALLIRVYVIAALLALVPNFLAGDATLAQLAITLGVALSAAGSLESLAGGLTQAAAAWVAWQMIRPTLQAAKRATDSDAERSSRSLGAPTGVHAGSGDGHFGGIPEATTTAKSAAEFHGESTADETVLRAQDIHFAHQGRHGSVLNGCNLRVHRGDRILLEGPSGGGKSTFAAILAGHRSPSGGFVLAGGLDRHTLGDAAWRQHIALAPQYHENHLFSASLSFNLLVGRPLPHSPKDIHDAREICGELGLDALVDNMPAGMAQMVGDTGWRVSQGERSRIFLARALLQNAAVIVLDESLAALDPENLKHCLECVRRRAASLILIAHP